MKGHAVEAGTRQRMREAKLGRKHTLGTRIKMSTSHAGKVLGDDVKAKISTSQRRYYDELRRACAQSPVPGDTRRPAAAAAAGGGLRAAAGDKALKPLVMERAVSELVALRRELLEWMTRHEQVFGYKPSLEEAASDSPVMYSRFVRYMALRDFVRDSNM